VGSWYWIGVSAGLGAALGVLGGLTGRYTGVIAVLGSGIGAGVLVDLFLPGGLGDLVGAPVGAMLGFIGAAPIVAGALRRGGTRGGIAVFLTGAAVVIAGIAFIPVAGYLEALALPALAARLRRTQPERYAGLRTLARD
jgi:hypothetical protein